MDKYTCIYYTEVVLYTANRGSNNNTCNTEQQFQERKTAA